MKTFFPVVLILSFLCSSCHQNHASGANNAPASSIIVKGVISGGEDQLVTLDRMGPVAFEAIDSVRCSENGKFSFSFTGEGMDFYALKYTEQGYITLIAEPGDEIVIRGNAGSAHPYTVEGSEASELVRQLAVKHREILNRMRLISEQSNDLLGEDNYAQIKQQLNRQFDSLVDVFHAYSTEFIYQHPASPAILIALYNQYGPGLPVFQPENDLDVYVFADSALYAHYPGNEAVLSLHTELQAVLQQLKREQSAPGPAVGAKAPDFVSNTPGGKPLALSELRGKYVLLQFWASWSKPSMEENTYLAECYKKFGDRAFAILQVSLDDNPEAWVSAIDEENPGWYQVSDLLRWESPAANLYKVDRIPANFLINPEGIIVEKDIFGSELIATIDKYLSK